MLFFSWQWVAPWKNRTTGLGVSDLKNGLHFTFPLLCNGVASAMPAISVATLQELVDGLRRGEPVAAAAEVRHANHRAVGGSEAEFAPAIGRASAAAVAGCDLCERD